MCNSVDRLKEHCSNISSLQNRRDFLRISGEQGRKRGKRELRARGGLANRHSHRFVAVVIEFLIPMRSCSGGSMLWRERRGLIQFNSIPCFRIEIAKRILSSSSSSSSVTCPFSSTRLDSTERSN